VRCIRDLPAGTVSSYGAIARAAGWPELPVKWCGSCNKFPDCPGTVWSRGGAIKLGGENAAEQRFACAWKALPFVGARDMKRTSSLEAVAGCHLPVASTSYPVAADLNTGNWVLATDLQRQVALQQVVEAVRRNSQSDIKTSEQCIDGADLVEAHLVDELLETRGSSRTVDAHSNHQSQWSGDDLFHLAGIAASDETCSFIWRWRSSMEACTSSFFARRRSMG